MTDAGSSSLEDLDWGQWFARNGRNVLVGAVFVVLAVAGFWWYRAHQAQKEGYAAQALDQARSSAEAGNLPLAASDLSRVIDQFKGTRSGDQAAILLAQVRLLQGQAPQAVAGLQSFVEGSHPDYVAASAYGLIGAGLEEQNKYRDAGAAYRRAADKAPLDFQKAQFLIDAARALANGGDTTGARAALSVVLKDYSRLDQASEARVRMAEIGGEVPPPPADLGQANSRE